MAVQKLGVDTNVSHESATVYSYSFTHTLVASPNNSPTRMIVVATGGETEPSLNNPVWVATSVTYGGVAMTKLVSSTTTENATSLNNNTSSIWILKEANLPANGLQTIQVNGTVNAGSTIYNFASCAEYWGVAQNYAANTAASFVNSPAPSPTISNTVDPNNGDLVVSSYICGNGGSFTVGQGQVEIFDAVNTVSAATTTFGFCELVFAAPGPYTLSSTYSATANRLTRVAASMVARRNMNLVTQISTVNGITRHNMGTLNGVI